MEINHNPYTYAIKNKINGKWYYGVKYAKNADPDAFFINYFTSSNEVKTDIELHGTGIFDHEIRKIFKVDDYDSWECAAAAAKEWEHTVLRRMNVRFRNDCYNKHDNKSFPVMEGDCNPAKREDVRRKLSINALTRTTEQLSKIGASGSKTKLTKSILNALKHRKSPIIKKVSKDRYANYATFIELHRPELVRLIKYFETLSTMCKDIPKKPYIRTKPSGPRSKETRDKISKSKVGRYHYLNTITGEKRVFAKHDDIPEDWIRGMHDDDTKEKLRVSSTGRLHTDVAKNKMSNNRSNSMYFTSPDLTEYKQYSNMEDVPEGWIKGIKVKSRNDKIAKNNRWSK